MQKKYKIYFGIVLGVFVAFLILLGGASVSVGDTDTTEELLIGIGNSSQRTKDVQALVDGDKIFDINDGVYIMMSTGADVTQVAFTLKMSTIKDGKVELYLSEKDEKILLYVADFIGAEETDISLSCSVTVTADWNFGGTSEEALDGSFLAFRVVDMGNNVIIDCSLSDFRIY